MIKSVTSASGKTFVELQKGASARQVLAVSMIAAMAILDTAETKIIGAASSKGVPDLIVDTTVDDILEAAPGRFIEVTLGADDSGPAAPVWLNVDYVEAIMEMGGTWVATRAFHVPMPVEESRELLLERIAATTSELAKAA